MVNHAAFHLFANNLSTLAYAMLFFAKSVGAVRFMPDSLQKASGPRGNLMELYTRSLPLGEIA
jgi:hypothetical protein